MIMKRKFCQIPSAFCGLGLLLPGGAIGIDADRQTNSVPLTEIAVENLGIETREVDRRDFEATFFAIGELREIPSSRSVLSSRIAGRAVEVNAYPGDEVEAGQVLVVVESLQPGDPPPRILLEAARSGIVVASHVRLGQPVEPSTELLDVADRGMLWAVATIPEHHAARMGPGSKARLRIPSFGEEAVEVTMSRWDTDADPLAGSLSAIFEIPNPEGKLLPGMRAEFSVITGTRENVLAVPKESVQGPPTNRVVFVRDFDLPTVFVRAPVVLREENDTHIEVVLADFFRATRWSPQVLPTGCNPQATTPGLSLKEVLDAAHGHEHNEDGSEMTAEQKAAKEAQKKAASGQSGGGVAPKWILYYAGTVTVALLIALQFWWIARRKLNRARS